MKLKSCLFIKYFFILFFTLIFSGIPFQKELPTRQNGWQDGFDKGMELLNTGNPEGAEEQFKAILKQDKKIAQAYYGLGLVEISKNPGSRKAIREFEKAVKIDRKFAEAYYQIGMVYKNQKFQSFKAREYFQKATRADPSLAEAWFELAKVEQELWPQGEQVSLFAKAVKASPRDERVYKQFVQAAMWYNKEKEVFKTLDFLINAYPEEPCYLLDKARFLLLIDEHQKSIEFLESIEEKFPHFSPARVELAKAQNYFEIDSSDFGLKCYWKGVQSIKDTLEASLYFKDVRYIMNSSEYSLLQTLPVDSLSKFYNRFWTSRDPDLSTIKNERIPEHYKRLQYARKNFRRYISEPRVMEFAHETDHPYTGYNVQGSKLLEQSNLSSAVPLDFRDLDDLGVIYVRHGDPDEQVTSISGIPFYVDMSEQQFTSFRVPRPYMGESLQAPEYLDNLPMNWSWRYFKKYNCPEMVFHFKKYNGILGWIIETIPYTVAEREHLDTKYYQLGRESFRAEPIAGAISRLCEEIGTESLDAVKVALNTETTIYSYQAEPLVFPLQILSFKGKNNKTLVEIYYLIDGKYVDLDTTGNTNQLDLNQFFSIFNFRWDEIHRIERTNKIPLNLTPEEWKAPLALQDLETFNLSPGRYHFEFHLKDNVSRRLGVYKDEYPVKDFSGNILALSDVILTHPFEPTRSSRKFVKGNISYIPHMFLPYPLGSQVGIYFEIYNLSKNSNQDAQFRVSCTLKGDEKSNGNPGKLVKGFFRSVLAQNPVKISTSYDYTSKLTDENIYLNFQIEENKPGKYLLEIEVKDLNSNITAKRDVGFIVTD
jgi:tetratricopeptide (TPR) repeat protein